MLIKVRFLQSQVKFEEGMGSVVQSREYGDLSGVINKVALYDEDPIRSQVQEAELLQTFYKSERYSPFEQETNNTETEGSSEEPADVGEMRKSTAKIESASSDVQSLKSLLSVEEQLQEQGSHSDE